MVKKKKRPRSGKKPRVSSGQTIETRAADMAELDRKIRACTLCRLHESRTNAVPGAGNTKEAELMFIGEAPGRKEDATGEPFVGAAGKVLSDILAEAGLDRSKVFITNIVKCRPPQNRKPLPDEVKTCTSNYLDHQIKLLNPKLICTLGATALEYFTGEKKIGDARGKLTKSKDGHLVFPTYHPASVFRNRSLKSTLEQDIKSIRSVRMKL
jgi:uracil-DNA glycosylase